VGPRPNGETREVTRQADLLAGHHAGRPLAAQRVAVKRSAAE
jgi:hypothetical protein